MIATEIKETLHDLIDKIEDKELLNAYLKIIKSGAEKNQAPDVIGYTCKGEPLTQSLLSEKVIAASNRVKSGKYISQEDLEKAAENW